MSNYEPTEYKNITTDKKGFYFTVSDKVDGDDIYTAVTTHSADSRGAPVKRFNHSGFDVLKRSGYFPPVGEIDTEKDEDGEYAFSSIVDIALGEAGTYSLVDYAHRKIYTYSEFGELLYAFGGTGSQIGAFEAPVAADYKGSSLLVLDSLLERVTVFTQTAYGGEIIRALDFYRQYRFDESISEWQKLLDANPNFDLAYDGIGRAYLNQEKYREAMDCFAFSNNDTQYSAALKGYRSQLVSEYLLFIVLAAAGVITLVVFAGKAVARVNRAGYKTAKRALVPQLAYGFRLLTHPLDSFWDLKHEKRGGPAAATVILALFYGISAAQKVMSARLFNRTYFEDIDLLMEFIQTAGVVLLFVLANWCLTTLMNGDGSLRDVYMAVCYAMFPMVLLKAVSIPLSYLFTLEEGMYIGFLSGFGLVWALLLVFLGIKTVHQFSLLKTFVTCLLSILGISIITAVILLFTTTLGKMIQFFHILFTEIFR
jgi:tetratricopeptide (TPR) repeat protein